MHYGSQTLSREYVLVTAKLHLSSNALLIMALLVQGVAEARPNGFSNLRPHTRLHTEVNQVHMGVEGRETWLMRNKQSMKRLATGREKQLI